MKKNLKFKEGTLFSLKDVENLNLPYENILDLPLEALLLPEIFTKTLNGIISVYSKTNQRHKYETLKDLLSTKKSDVERHLSRVNKEYPGNNMIGEIEQKLALLGLKFEDSDMSAFDIKLSELLLDKETKEFLKKLHPNAKYVENICILNPAKLKTSTKKSAIIQDLRTTFNTIGVKFVDASYKLNLDILFPLRKEQIAMLPEEARLPYLEQKQKVAEQKQYYGNIKRYQKNFYEYKCDEFAPAE